MRLILVPCLFLLALSMLISPATGAELSRAIAVAAGDDPAASMAAIRDLARADQRVVTELVDMFGGENDDKARRVLHGLAVHVSSPGHKSERAAYNKEVCSLLESDRPVAVKEFLIEQLHFSGGDDVVSTLSRLLSDGDHHEPARQALAAIGTRKAAVALEQKLSDAGAEQKVGLIQALGYIGNARSLSMLMKQADSDNEAVRNAAIAALGSLGNARAERIIRNHLYVGPLPSRRVATDAYLKIADQLAVSRLRVLPGALNTKVMAKEMYTRVIQASHDPAMRYAAKNGLRRLSMED